MSGRNFKSKRGGAGVAWNPKVDAQGDSRYVADENDFIDGIYLDKKEGVGEHNATIYVIQDEETGEERDVWGNKVLNEQFEKIKMGSFVRVKFLGARLKAKVAAGTAFSDKSKNYYFDWEVFVDEASAPTTSNAAQEELAPSLAPSTGGFAVPTGTDETLPF